jgi:acetyl-CoA synthetase
MVEREVEKTIEALLEERRTFEPPGAFVDQANVNDASVYDRAAKDPDAYWAEQAERLDWFEPFSEVMQWEPPHHKWFLGGKLNAAYNCIDRHLEANSERVAYYWIGEPGDTRTITYADLQRQVCQAANALIALGVQAGDRVAMLAHSTNDLFEMLFACYRLGALLVPLNWRLATGEDPRVIS